MATLLQILAKDLKPWPKEAKCIAQNANSRAYPYSGAIEYMGDEWAGQLQVASYLVELKELAEDHKTAIITKCMWEAEVACMVLGGNRAPQANPLAWRDRIHNIDIIVQELEEERLSLVQSLEAEGFALINAKREPAEYMTDWRNWKEGDLVECVTEGDGPAAITIGCVYKIKDYRGSPSVMDDDGDHMVGCIREGCFKFVSRP